MEEFTKLQLLFHLQVKKKKIRPEWGLNLGPSDYYTKHYMTMATEAWLQNRPKKVKYFA